eukprot:jgi/Galph1/5833/GphlegSOOS_G4451.1
MEGARRTKRKWDEKEPDQENFEEEEEERARIKAAEAAKRLNESLAARGFVKEAQEGAAASHEAVVDINDSSQRRYILHSATLRNYEAQFGVAVVPRGRYYAPEEKPDMTTFSGPDSEKPLFLLITASDPAAVQKAKEALEEAAAGSTPILRSSHPGLGSEGQKRDRIYEKIATHMDVDLSGRPFRLIERLKGPDLSYIKYIEQETNCRVYLRGKGTERGTTVSSGTAEEPLYFQIQAPDEDSMHNAKALVEDLLDAIRPEYEKACVSHAAALQAYHSHGMVTEPIFAGGAMGYPYSDAGGMKPIPLAVNASVFVASSPGTSLSNEIGNFGEDVPPPPPPPPMEDDTVPPPPPPPPDVGNEVSDAGYLQFSAVPNNRSMHGMSGEMDSYHCVPPPPADKFSKSRNHNSRRK